MGKKQKQRGGNKSSSSSSSHFDQSAQQQQLLHNQHHNQQQQQSKQNQQHNNSPVPSQPRTSLLKTLEKWIKAEKQGILWVVTCVCIGCCFGFGIGSGWLTGASSSQVAPWRIELGSRIRASFWYQILFLWPANPNGVTSNGSAGGPLNPSHPRVFAVLREAIVRESNGYVYPDLGILSPAPCGASRGIGMVRHSYHKCQTKCFPGVAMEKAALRRNQRAKLLRDPNSTLWLPPIPDHQVYKQEEVLIRVPLSFQMTRTVALDTLLSLLPGDVQRKASPHELDDAALLVLLLAHERGVGRHSRWLPYIASLPKEPSCGYSPRLRPYLLNSMRVLQEELGVDTYGWKGELMKAHKHAAKIAQGLTKDYGAFLKTPEGVTVHTNIEWALCQVTSRATAGSEEYGALRLVPMMDMINHDANAGGFVELTGKERLEHSNFVEATEEDAGTFVIRSLRHGQRKALKKGQELLVNYNVPHYSPLDWFVSMGFVPRERQTQWQKMDAALPRVRQDNYGVGADNARPTSEVWEEEYGPQMVKEWKELQKQRKQNKQVQTGGTGNNFSSPTTATSKESEEENDSELY